MASYSIKVLSQCTEYTHNLLHERLPVTPYTLNNLLGACAIGAFALLEVLYKRGVRGAHPVCDRDDWDLEHWWVRVGGYDLDPTYEQFDPDQPWLCVPKHPMTSAGTVLGAKIPADWPLAQHPKTFWEALGLGTWP